MSTSACPVSMITPDPGADEARRRGLRQDAHRRGVAAGPGRHRVRRHAGPGGCLGLRQRRCRGVDGRRDRRLVRGDRALQAPAGPADPAHRADPAAARTSSVGGSRSSSARTSSRRTSSASGWPRRRSRPGVGDLAHRPGQRPPGGRRGRPTSPPSGSARSATSTSTTSSPRPCVPRFREEPISPILGSLLAEVVRDDLHHGVVDLALEEMHRWLVHNPDTFTEVLERAGAVVGAAAAQRGRHPPPPPEAIRWVADIRDDPRSPRARGPRLDAGPARRRTC